MTGSWAPGAVKLLSQKTSSPDMTTLVAKTDDVHALEFALYKGFEEQDRRTLKLFPQGAEVDPGLVHPAMDKWMADNSELFTLPSGILLHKTTLVKGDEAKSICRLIVEAMIQARYRKKTVLLFD